jgi:hypothetical protein
VEPPANLTCANCGSATERDAEFCANCGAHVAPAPPIASLREASARSGGRTLGYAAGIIFGLFAGAAVSLFVGSLSMTAAMSSTAATGGVSVALLAIVALLVALIVRVARGKTGSSPALNAFLVTFAIVCGGGLAICSGIGFFTLFGK